MNPAPLSCTKCNKWLPGEIQPGTETIVCPSCRTNLVVDLFPAFFRALTPGGAGERVVVEGESTCFFHSEKKAVAHCEMCGRFVCALCDLELNGKHLCPSCLESGVQKGKLEQLQHKCRRYDRIALMLGVVPLLCIWPATCVTAIAAIYMAIRYWNAPTGPVARGGKARMVLTMVLGFAQLGAWVFFVYWLFVR